MTQPTGASLQQILLLCGIPGTGKTTFCRYLDEEHNHIHFDLEHPETWPTKWGKSGFHDALLSTWETSRREFVDVLHRRYGNQFQGAALDWGFPPTRLSWVNELGSAGAKVIWMDAADDVARQIVIRRGGNMEAFERQMEAIQEAGIPQSLPDARIIQACDANGRHVTPVDLYQQVGSPDR